MRLAHQEELRSTEKSQAHSYELRTKEEVSKALLNKESEFNRRIQEINHTHSQECGHLKNSVLDEVSKLRSQHETQLNQIRGQHSTELSTLKNQHSSTTQELTHKHTLECKSIESGLKQQIESIHASYKHQLQQLESSIRSEMKAQISGKDEKIRELQITINRFEEQIKKNNENFRRESEEIRNAYSTEITQMKHAHSNECGNLNN